MARRAATSQSSVVARASHLLLLLFALFLLCPAGPLSPRTALARDARHGDYVEDGRRGAGGSSVGSSSSTTTRKKPVAFGSSTSASSSSTQKHADFNSAAAVAARKRGAERALEAARAAERERSERGRRDLSYLDSWRGEKRLLSWSPRAFLVKDFLTDDECDYLIEKAAPQLEVSTVVDAKTGESLPSKVRTSSGTFFDIGEDPVIESIERRIAIATGFPVENGEGLQVLKYVDGQNYQPHDDFFSDEFNVLEENGGQRVATFLMYLTTPEEGGETVFPSAARKVTGPGWSDCAREGFAVKPRRRDALLFYSLKPNGKKDEDSLHGSCPVLKGEKWSSTKWIHVVDFGGAGAAKAKEKWSGKGSTSASSDPGDCRDLNGDCAGWAQRGECARNPKYMLNACRKSCGTCGSGKSNNAVASARATSDADDALARLRAAAEKTARARDKAASRSERDFAI